MTGSGRPVLAVLGEALIDFVEDGDDDPRLARPGGSPYNVAIGLARLDRHAAFVGRLSRDPLGQVLRRHAERSDVDLSRCVDTADPSTIALVELDHGYARYHFGVDGTADFRFTDDELANAVDGAAALHFGSLTSWTAPGDAAVARLVARVRERIFVSYDPNVRPQLQPDADAARAQVEAAIALAHLVKTSTEDVDHLYPGRPPEAVAREWLGLGCTAVIVTHGGQGATLYTAAQEVTRPAVVTNLIDTIGAGDSFMSGILDALTERSLLDPARLGEADAGTLAELLDHAALIAAITCARAGANPPRRAELADFGAAQPAGG